MTYSMRLAHLDVGQGTGTFLEVYDDSSGKYVLVHTALFDFGSDHDTKEAGGPSVEYVVAKLKTMKQPTLDAVMLSHSDLDHITLLTKLLKAFDPYDKKDPKKTQLRVLYSAHGGAEEDYKKAGFNVLDELKRYMKANDKVDQSSVAIPAEYSSYKYTSNAPLREIGPVKVWVLVGNYPNGALGTTPTRNGKGKLDAFTLNTVSLVCVLGYAFMQMIETGDATGATIKWANRILEYDDMKDYINDVKGMTVPHHGSAVTMFDFGKASGEGVSPQTNLRTFLDRIKAKSYTVSAAESNTHRHPNALLLDYFWRRVQDGDFYTDPVIDPYHYYTAFFKSGSLERLEQKGKKTIRQTWPPDWPDKIVMKKPKVVKAPKKKGPKKPPPKPVPTPVPVEENRLTVRMQRPVYSSVYYSTDTTWEYVGYPPDPIKELTPLDVKAKRPPRGVAWVYSTTFDDPTHASTSILRETNRRSLVELRRAMDAGVAPEDLPEVPPEDLPPYQTAAEESQSADGAPAAWPVVPSQRPRPRPRPRLAPDGAVAVPAPGSGMRRLEVIR